MQLSNADADGIKETINLPTSAWGDTCITTQVGITASSKRHRTKRDSCATLTTNTNSCLILTKAAAQPRSERETQRVMDGLLRECLKRKPLIS